MKRQLPKLKKTISSFIANEDARLISDSAKDLSLSFGLIAVSLSLGGEGVYSAEATHSNFLFVPDDVQESSGKEPDVKVNSNLFNKGDEAIDTTISAESVSEEVTLNDKEVKVVHGNHYNHMPHGDDKK